MGVLEVGYEGEDWIEVAGDIVQWLGFMNMVMDLWIL